MHNNQTPCRGRRRLLARLNIGVQASIPLAVLYITPAHATAGLAPPEPAQYAVSQQTRPYTLLTGEDADLVARRFGISVEALRKLNQFRTFARGFDISYPSG